MFNKRGSIILILILFIGISNVKALTSDNITYENEGVTESLTSAIDKLYSELKEYKTNGSVTSTEMLEGYTGYAKGKLVSGSIKKKGSTTYTPGVNNQIINRGQYLDEDQVIIGDKDLVAENIKSGVELFGVNGTYTSDANAVSNQILSGKTAYVNGNKITGNMANKAGATVTASTTTSDATYTYLTIPQAGYYDTTSKVKVENSKISSGLLKEKTLLTNRTISPGGSVNVTIPAKTKVVYVTSQYDSNRMILLFWNDGTVVTSGYRLPVEKISDTTIKVSVINDQYASSLTVTVKCIYID